jgi:hypothetical protein
MRVFRLISPAYLRRSVFSVSFSSSSRSPELGEGISFHFLRNTPLEKISVVFSQACVLFNAESGYSFNFLLNNLHDRGWRAYERALSQYPPEEHDRFFPPEFPSGVQDSLPALLLVDEFDNREVPTGVEWLNHWSSRQVENLGRDRVLSAGWEQIIPHENGALTLVTTREPTSVLNSDHLQKIGVIVNHLDLCQVQQRFQY